MAVLTSPIAGAPPLCGVFAGKRSNGTRVTVIGIEALSLLSGVLGRLQGGGVSVLPGMAFAPAVLRGFSSAEARNRLAR
ncbi:hypothetical protein AB0O75_23020 [Streptomyces sp. NPDC088921]|uniref:hypothetical protein n=1 Tax=unclassified Streptomyces TaxID=2593676 RepID=UPI00341E7C79